MKVLHCSRTLTKKVDRINRYGEIYFLGYCNCKCFYCIGKEASATTRDEQITMVTPPQDFKNFDQFLRILKEKEITTVYLSSIKTDPLLYRYLNEITDLLIGQGISVGIRTNGYLFWENIDVFRKLNAEISFSVQAFDGQKNKAICEREDIPDWQGIINWLRAEHKTCRFTMVLNRYNEGELEKLLNLCADNADVVDYVQGRILYKEYGDTDPADLQCFNNTHNTVKLLCGEPYAYYGGAPSYWWKHDCNKISVSFWSKPFEKDTIDSVNYFVTGQITTSCKIIPGKEEHVEEIIA